jgi:hypothetical protein
MESLYLKYLKKRLKLYEECSLKNFEGFKKSDINSIAKLFTFIPAFESFSKDLDIFVKVLQMDICHSQIIRLYQKTEKSGKYGGNREIISTIKSHKFTEFKGGICVSTIYPFADIHWDYDLSKRELDNYLFITFNFLSKTTIVGYRITKSKNIKSAFNNSNEFYNIIKKNRILHHKSMIIKSVQHSQNMVDSLEMTIENFEDFNNSREYYFQFEYPTSDYNLKEKVISTLVRLRDIVNTLNLFPILMDVSRTGKLQIDESFCDDEEVQYKKD